MIIHTFNDRITYIYMKDCILVKRNDTLFFYSFYSIALNIYCTAFTTIKDQEHFTINS